MKTNEGISVVYYDPNTKKTFTKGFLYAPEEQHPQDAAEIASKWQPIGLATETIMVPFDTEYINWLVANQQLGGNMPNCTELTFALSRDFREDFDHCAKILKKPELSEVPMPLATYPEGFNLHPMHRARYAPFFYPNGYSAGYGERALPMNMRLARRM